MYWAGLKRQVATVGLKLVRQIIALWNSVSQHQFFFRNGGFRHKNDKKKTYMVVD
jgi:hypothetical protein